MNLSNFLDDLGTHNNYYPTQTKTQTIPSNRSATNNDYLQLNGNQTHRARYHNGNVHREKAMPLYEYEDTPEFLQNNPFIRNGYRVYLTTEQCVKSLFTWNNETLNMWTHFVGFVLFFNLMLYDNLFRMPQLNANWVDHVIITVGLLCFQMCMVCSALYHMFRCRSEASDKQWFAYDLTGISVGILGCYIPGVHYAFTCHPMWEEIYMMIVTALFVAVLSCQTQPRYYTDAWIRRRIALYCGLVLYGVLPTLHWIYLNGGFGTDIVMVFAPKVLTVYVIGIVAFFFYLSMTPEKCSPGRFDYVGHSHQMWHIIILLAFLYWHEAGLDLLQYRTDNICPINQ